MWLVTMFILLAGCAPELGDSGGEVDGFDDGPEAGRDEIATATSSKSTTWRDGDNDWSGSTTYFKSSSSKGSWTYTTPGQFGDLRYTNSTSAYYFYYWQTASVPTSGSVEFRVWVPWSDHATGQAYYYFYCSNGSTTKSSYKVLNQNNYASQYVSVGTLSGVASSSSCGLAVSVYSLDSGEYIAADAVQLGMP